MHPVTVLAIFWSALSVATVVLAPEYHFSAASYLAIVLLQISALIGGVLGLSILAPRAKTQKEVVLWHPRAISWVSIAFGFSAAALILWSKGNSISSLISFSQLADVSRDLSVARYEDDYRMPLLARILQMFVFFSAMVCGSQFALNPSSMRKYEFFLPIAALAFISVLLTTRATIIFGLLFWIGAWLASAFFKASSADWHPLSTRVVINSLLAACVAAISFIWLQFLRGGITDDFSRLPEVMAHLKKWPLGSLAGFSAWFDSGETPSPALGYYSFTGIFDTLGIRERETGLYTNFVDLGDGSQGNIFTVFRALIDDFSLGGAFLAIFLFGIASSLAISLCRRKSLGGLAMLAIIYPYVMFSSFTSFYSFLGHIVAAAAFTFYLSVFCKKKG
ncbi:O-antigen polymerase [Luteimonas terrae]|nr:O-antigen polymerase [Luteimonas terrae]